MTWDGTIRVSGATIKSATTFAFDSAADGIVAQTANELTFKSGTTGDIDGIELDLDQAAKGSLHFASRAGSCRVDLAGLDTTRKCYDFGGLGIRACVERYPTALTELEANLSTEIEASTRQTTPHFVKVIQADGHMTWSSSIYISPQG